MCIYYIIYIHSSDNDIDTYSSTQRESQRDKALEMQAALWYVYVLVLLFVIILCTIAVVTVFAGRGLGYEAAAVMISSVALNIIPAIVSIAFTRVHPIGKGLRDDVMAAVGRVIASQGSSQDNMAGLRRHLQELRKAYIAFMVTWKPVYDTTLYYCTLTASFFIAYAALLWIHKARHRMRVIGGGQRVGGAPDDQGTPGQVTPKINNPFEGVSVFPNVQEFYKVVDPHQQGAVQEEPRRDSLINGVVGVQPNGVPKANPLSNQQRAPVRASTGVNPSNPSNPSIPRKNQASNTPDDEKPPTNKDTGTDPANPSKKKPQGDASTQDTNEEPTERPLLDTEVRQRGYPYPSGQKLYVIRPSGQPYGMGLGGYMPAFSYPAPAPPWYGMGAVGAPLLVACADKLFKRDAATNTTDLGKEPFLADSSYMDEVIAMIDKLLSGKHALGDPMQRFKMLRKLIQKVQPNMEVRAACHAVITLGLMVMLLAL
jgi:hypothetical protein